MPRALLCNADRNIPYPPRRRVQATRTFELCAREAAQIFGGNSYVRGGRGEKARLLLACSMRKLLRRAFWRHSRC